MPDGLERRFREHTVRATSDGGPNDPTLLVDFVTYGRFALDSVTSRGPRVLWYHSNRGRPIGI